MGGVHHGSMELNAKIVVLFQRFLENPEPSLHSLLSTVLILVIMGWTPPSSPSEAWSLSPANLSSARRLFLATGRPSSSRASTSWSNSS